LEFTTTGQLLAAACSDGYSYIFHCTDTNAEVSFLFLNLQFIHLFAKFF